ncbi:MAG: FliH/SctL family protein [Lautropia sp.]
MSYLFWQRDAHVAIASTRRVLRAAEVPALADAQALCGRLNALYAGESARVDAAARDAGARGHAEGVAAGARAARDDVVAALAELARATAASQAGIRREVAALALQVARRLVGALGEGERLVALAEQAARELVPTPTIRLTVHPQRADAVRACLADATRDRPEAPLPFELDADPAVPLDACRLDNGLGTVDASLDVQLARLAAAWQVARS